MDCLGGLPLYQMGVDDLKMRYALSIQNTDEDIRAGDTQLLHVAVQQFCADHYVCTPMNNVTLVDGWSSEITGMLYDAHCWPNVWATRPVA